MSIVAYTGMPGSGKSYAAVEHQILPALKAGRVVVTNIPVKADLIRNDIPAADLREFPLQSIATQPELMAEAVPPGAILVLDEVWRLFPSGTKANQVPEQFRSFFAEHRHRVDSAGNSTQIVLVTQDLAQIGAFARQLVEQTFHVVKLSTLGIPMSNRYRVDMYAGPVSGPNPPQNGRIRQVFGRYDKRIYQYYVSHTQSQASEDQAPNEKGIDARANIFKKPFLVALPFIAVGVAAFVWFKGGYLMDKYHKKPQAAAATAPAAGGRSVAVPPPPSSPSALATAVARVEGAGDWRVIGTLINSAHPERSYAVLSGTKAKSILVPWSRCVEGQEGDPIRCRYDGFWYSESGRAVVASAENEPLKIWTQGAAPVTAVKPEPSNGSRAASRSSEICR